jgi:hypothetical protein
MGHRSGCRCRRPLRQGIALAVGLVLGVLAAGCMQASDINRRVLIYALGVDASPQGSGVRVEVGFQSAISAGKLEGSGSAWVTAEANGTTVTDAVDGLLGQVGGKPFFGSARLLVVGAGEARRGIADIIDATIRNPWLPPSEPVVVATGEAAAILSAKTPDAPSPALHLLDMLEGGGSLDSSLTARPMFRLFDQMTGFTSAVWTPAVAPGPDGPEVTGDAVFSGGRMVAVVPRDQDALLATIRPGGPELVTLPALRGSAQPLTLSFSSLRTRARVRTWSDPIRVTMTGIASVMEGPGLAARSTDNAPVGADAGQTLAERMTALLTTLYGRGADVLGLQEQMRRRLGLQVAPATWAAEMPHVRFAVTVRTAILGGLRGA